MLFAFLLNAPGALCTDGVRFGHKLVLLNMKSSKSLPETPKKPLHSNILTA